MKFKKITQLNAQNLITNPTEALRPQRKFYFIPQIIIIFFIASLAPFKLSNVVVYWCFMLILAQKTKLRNTSNGYNILLEIHSNRFSTLEML